MVVEEDEGSETPPFRKRIPELEYESNGDVGNDTRYYSPGGNGIEMSRPPLERLMDQIHEMLSIRSKQFEDANREVDEAQLRADNASVKLRDMQDQSRKMLREYGLIFVDGSVRSDSLKGDLQHLEQGESRDRKGKRREGESTKEHHQRINNPAKL